MNIARIALAALLALLLITTSSGKLSGAASSLAIRDSLNIPAGRWKAIGIGELLIVAGLITGIWVAPLGIAAALGVVVLMIGAIIARRAAGGAEQRSGIVADFVILIVALATTGLGLAVV